MVEIEECIFDSHRVKELPVTLTVATPGKQLHSILQPEFVDLVIGTTGNKEMGSENRYTLWPRDKVCMQEAVQEAV